MDAPCGLGPDAGERAWLQNLQRLQDGRNGKQQIIHSIGLCAYNQNSNWEGDWVLLEFHPFVVGDQNVKFTSCQCQQLSVLDARPAMLLYRGVPK